MFLDHFIGHVIGRGLRFRAENGEFPVQFVVKNADERRRATVRRVDKRHGSVVEGVVATTKDIFIVFALFVDIGGTQGNSTVLQNCVTDSSKYYDLTSASQIDAAFTAIGQQITNLRVSQ